MLFVFWGLAFRKWNDTLLMNNLQTKQKDRHKRPPLSVRCSVDETRLIDCAATQRTRRRRCQGAAPLAHLVAVVAVMHRFADLRARPVVKGLVDDPLALGPRARHPRPQVPQHCARRAEQRPRDARRWSGPAAERPGWLARRPPAAHAWRQPACLGANEGQGARDAAPSAPSALSAPSLVQGKGGRAS